MIASACGRGRPTISRASDRSSVSNPPLTAWMRRCWSSSITSLLQVAPSAAAAPVAASTSAHGEPTTSLSPSRPFPPAAYVESSRARSRTTPGPSARCRSCPGCAGIPVGTHFPMAEGVRFSTPAPISMVQRFTPLNASGFNAPDGFDLAMSSQMEWNSQKPKTGNRVENWVIQSDAGGAPPGKDP